MRILLAIFWLGVIGAAVSYARDKRKREREAAEIAARNKAMQAHIAELCLQGEKEAAERIAERAAKRIKETTEKSRQ